MCYFVLLVLFVMLFVLFGCVVLIKNMVQELVDWDYGLCIFGVFVEDGNIECKIKVNLVCVSEVLDQSYIVVVSFNGNVLLVGEVVSDELCVQVENIVVWVCYVCYVYNELKLFGDSGVLFRVNDGWLIIKLKICLFVDGDVLGMCIKVVIVSGIVYLMGLFICEEVDVVVVQVCEVGGVQKIVKIIEYIDQCCVGLWFLV